MSNYQINSGGNRKIGGQPKQKPNAIYDIAIVDAGKLANGVEYSIESLRETLVYICGNKADNNNMFDVLPKELKAKKSLVFNDPEQKGVITIGRLLEYCCGEHDDLMRVSIRGNYTDFVDSIINSARILLSGWVRNGEFNALYGAELVTYSDVKHLYSTTISTTEEAAAE